MHMSKTAEVDGGRDMEVHIILCCVPEICCSREV